MPSVEMKTVRSRNDRYRRCEQARPAMAQGRHPRNRGGLPARCALLLILFGASCRTSQQSPCATDGGCASDSPAHCVAKLSGQFCTNTLDGYGVPIRILLVIDTSESMKLKDPGGKRSVAAGDLVTRYGSDQNVSFGLVGFNTAANQVTTGFVRDQAALASGLNDLNTAEGYTDYIAALSTAQMMIGHDLVGVRKQIAAAEQAGQDTRWMRPYYFVVFLGGGIPRMPGGAIQSNDEIW